MATEKKTEKKVPNATRKYNELAAKKKAAEEDSKKAKGKGPTPSN